MGDSFERLARLFANTDGSYSDYRCARNNSKPSMFVYDSVTRIVYYKFEETKLIGITRTETSFYMSPYISENGKYCRFIDNEIVEIP